MIELPFTEQVLIAIIAGPVASILAGLGWFARKIIAIHGDASAARFQVENDHETNLREDNDEKHAELKDAIAAIGESFELEIRAINTRLDGHLTRFNNIDVRLNNMGAKQ